MHVLKVKLSLHSRGTKEKSTFEISYADSLDNCVLFCYLAIHFLDNFDWYCALLQRIQDMPNLLKTSVSYNKKYNKRYLRPVPICSSTPSSLSSTTSSPPLRSVALFMHSSEQVQAFIEGRKLPTHRHRLDWQVTQHPQQTNSILACGAGDRSVQTISRGPSFSQNPCFTGSWSILSCKAFFRRNAW